MNTPDISIVVCTRNRASLLREALASLYDLATAEFTYEILVIDNGSTDQTPQVIVAAAAQSKHPLRVVVEPEPGVVAARNRGISEARGRWIAFFDDDQLADWHWLAELYRGAAEKKCRVVGGAVQLALPADCQRNLALTVRMLLGETVGGDEPQRYGGRLSPGCGNLMVERGVFDEVGHFRAQPSGRGEVTELFTRLQIAGLDAWHMPTAMIHHLTPTERLAREYLLRLAGQMGQNIARRQRDTLGLVRFTLLWLATAARMMAVEYPLLAWAKVRRNTEAALGWRCQVTISQGFLTGACGLATATVQPPREQTPVPPAINVEAPPAPPAPVPLPTPAPVFVVRAGEPTAVMEFQNFTVSAPAPTVPIQR